MGRVSEGERGAMSVSEGILSSLAFISFLGFIFSRGRWVASVLWTMGGVVRPGLLMRCLKAGGGVGEEASD